MPEAGEAAAARSGQRHRRRHEELGARARSNALHPLVPAADRRDGREARGLHQGHRRRPRDYGLLRQGACLRRTGCLQLPLRRSARDVRGPRLQRVGPHVFRLHQGRQSLHPDGVLLLRRRGARQEDTAVALDGGREPRGGEDPAALRRREGAQGDAPDRCRAGVLPDRPLALSAGARSSATSRPRGRSWTTTTSAPSARASRPI